MDEAKQRIGSEAAFAEQLQREGLTEDKLREKYREEIRRQQLAERIIQKTVPRSRVTAAEAEAYFKQYPAKFPRVPAEFRLAVIQIPVVADSAATAAARSAAMAARRRILGGEKFAKVAQELSDDPGSARSGGDLGFFGRGVMDAAFERAAFSLKPGVLSEPVRTPFGWHLLEVIEHDTLRTVAGKDSLDAQGRPVEEVHARHVLFKVEVTQEDANRAEALARSVRERASRGEDFAALAKRHSQYEGPQSEGGEIGWISLGTLQPAIRSGLQDLTAGQVSEPLANPAGYNIFKVLEVKPDRPYQLEEVRGELPEVVAQLKQRDRYEDWLKGLRAKAIIKIQND
jgi:peptidyl-prolyl cis-trans isomerase SurA